MRRADVVKSIARKLVEVGGEVSDGIRDAMREVYTVNRAYTCDAISRALRGSDATSSERIENSPLCTRDATGGAGAGAGVNVGFAQYDQRQIDVLMQEGQSPFSKIAYRHLGANRAVRQRLQSELAQSTMLGESQREIMARIRRVTGQTLYQARRVAQTERTRVQSQARNEAISEAAVMGINVSRKWTTRMVNSRDTHIALNGKIVPEGEPFELSDGDKLMYPGDPSGRAENVINCHCVLVPVVGRSTEMTRHAGYTHRKRAADGHQIITKAEYNRFTATFTARGGLVIRGEDAKRRFRNGKATASYIIGAQTAYIRDDATVSDVLEEMYHAEQDRTNAHGRDATDRVKTLREIDAQKYLLSLTDKCRIPMDEVEQTRANLEWYEALLQSMSDEE